MPKKEINWKEKQKKKIHNNLTIYFHSKINRPVVLCETPLHNDNSLVSALFNNKVTI